MYHAFLAWVAVFHSLGGDLKWSRIVQNETARIIIGLLVRLKWDDEKDMGDRCCGGGFGVTGWQGDRCCGGRVLALLVGRVNFPC